MDDQDKADYRRPLEAIYRDAYGRGYREGFKIGVEEKMWLHKSWPLIGIATGCVMLLVGIFIGAQVPT